MDSFDYKEEVSLKQKLRDTDNNEKNSSIGGSSRIKKLRNVDFQIKLAVCPLIPRSNSNF